MGSETSGGSVYTLGLVEPLNLGPGILNTWSGLEEIASFRCTLWTAEYDYNRHRAVIGKCILLFIFSDTHWIVEGLYLVMFTAQFYNVLVFFILFVNL